METKANYVLVGLFTLLAILAAFAFVYWTAAIGDRGQTAPLRVRIPGSASGLGRGSAVLFNGVKVGDVQRVYIDVNDPTLAIADTEVDRLTPITRSTQADIGIAGLTGQANIELRGANRDEPKILDEAEEAGKVAEITANPSAVANLLETAQDIFKRTDTVLSQLEGFVADVRNPLTRTIDNAEKFSEALGNNAQGVDDFLASATKLSKQLGAASDQLDSTLAAAEDLIRSVDRQQVRHIVGNVDTITTNLGEASGRVGDVVAHADDAVKSLTALSDGARRSLAKVDTVLDGVDPQAVQDTIENIRTAFKTGNEVFGKVNKVLDAVDPQAVRNTVRNIEAVSETATGFADRIDKVAAAVDPATIRTTIENIETVSRNADTAIARIDAILDAVDAESVRATISGIEAASRNARTITEDVSKVTSRFARHAGDVDSIMSDATKLAERLSKASVRVDGILAKVDSLLGSGETKGLVTQASDTLKSFKQVADTLNSRLGGIMDGLSRFSNQGLQDASGLIRDARRSIDRIEEAVSDFQRNPQRILTGGEGTVREYDGRARR
jgi:phospholipid/cholesterol/gamma-HCH transport system substrate-binding protein